MSDQNVFGGGNAHSLYTPMTDIEQGFLETLVERNLLEVEIKGWGTLVNFSKVIIGDLRLRIPLFFEFCAPDIHVPVYSFDLILKIREADIVLFEHSYSVIQGGLPLMVGTGFVLCMEWDIAIQEIDAKTIKNFMPQVTGLTTREGNRYLDTSKKELLGILRRGEEFVRTNTKKDADLAIHKQENDPTLHHYKV